MIHFELFEDVYNLPYNDSMELEMFYINFQFNIGDPSILNQVGFLADLRNSK